MITITSQPRMIRMSLPADPLASSIMCRFIRDLAHGASISEERIGDLQYAATQAFEKALEQQESIGEGRIMLRINIDSDEITVDLTYRDTHFPPAEFFSRS